MTETQTPTGGGEPLPTNPPLEVNPRAANPTPPTYAIGSVKQDPATLAVAVRTNILDPENRKDWGVMSVDRGGMYATWDQVSGWADLVGATPQAEEAPAEETSEASE